MRTYLGMPQRKVKTSARSTQKASPKAYKYELTLSCGHTVLRLTKPPFRTAYCEACRDMGRL